MRSDSHESSWTEEIANKEMPPTSHETSGKGLRHVDDIETLNTNIWIEVA